ncbi:hypothetical protein GCM10010282_40990 [Streptomyces roseolus]|nr:hypothetical protein GCM10010282_40990 [Streptomyces roseolus]
MSAASGRAGTAPAGRPSTLTASLARYDTGPRGPEIATGAPRAPTSRPPRSSSVPRAGPAETRAALDAPRADEPLVADGARPVPADAGRTPLAPAPRLRPRRGGPVTRSGKP